MCKMLGISAKSRSAANDMLREFFSYAEQNPHGWGLARFDEDGALAAPGVEKEPVKATASEHLRHLLEDKIDNPTILAHIRFATVGTMEYENCHPFTCADDSGRVWTLVHNGTVFSGTALNDYVGLQFGETDSERVLLHLVARINRAHVRLGRPLTEEERFNVLSSAIGALAKGNKLNLLVFDGEIMYVHTNFRDSLYFMKENGSLAFSTDPLSQGPWKPVPFMRLIAVKAGEFVREGTPHGNEYIHNPDDYRFVYMNFARL